MARRDRDRNEVEIDLEKYMALLDQLDDQEDVIKQLKDDARKLKEGVEESLSVGVTPIKKGKK